MTYPHPAYQDHRTAQQDTVLGFLSMKAQVGSNPGALEATGADPDLVAAQIAEDRATIRRAARMLRATPADPPSIRMMGLTEADLDGWADPTA